MTAKPAQRPPWVLLAIGLGLLAVGAAQLAHPDGPVFLGGVLAGVGATCVGRYVDRALRWLKERP